MANPDAVKYAKECRAAGMSKGQVRNALLDAKWDYHEMEDACDEAFGADPNDIHHPEKAPNQFVAPLPIALAKDAVWRSEMRKNADDPKHAADAEAAKYFGAIVLGSLALLGSFIWFRFSNWVLSQTEPATGIVIEFTSVAAHTLEADGRVTRKEESRPVVRFRSQDGREYTVAVKTSRFHQVGDAIEIAYDPAAPGQFAVIPDEFRWNLPQLLLAGAGAFSGMWGGYGAFRRRRMNGV